MKKVTNKNEIAILSGRWVTKLGNVIFDYINSISLANINTQNSVLIAIYQSSETIISLVMNLFSGVYADKTLHKKRMLIITDLISGLICIALSLFIHDSTIATVIIIANCLLAIVNSLNSPLYKTIIRETITRERIAKINSISNAGAEVLTLVGPLIGLWIVNIVGVKGGLVFNGLTFILSALLEALILVKSNDDNKSPSVSVLHDLYEGFYYVYSNKILFKLVIVIGLMNFFCAGFEVFIPYTDIIFNYRYRGIYASILVSQGIAGLVGSFASVYISKILRQKIKRIQLISFFAGLALMSIVFIERIDYQYIVLVPFFLVAFFITIYNIQYMSYVQEIVDTMYIGRTFGLLKVISLLFVPLGAFVFSSICSTAGSLCFFVTGGGIFLVSFISLFIFK